MNVMDNEGPDPNGLGNAPSAWAKGYAAAKEAQRGELEWQRGEIERQQWINRKLFSALKDMSEFWRYGMAKPDGAQPTAEDNARVEKLAKDAIDALVAAAPDYLSTLPPLETA